MVLAAVTAKTVFLIGLAASYGLALGPWWLAEGWTPKTPHMWQAHVIRGLGYFAWVPPFIMAGYLVWITLLSGTTIESAGDWVALLVGVPLYSLAVLAIVFGGCFFFASQAVSKGDEWRDKAVARKAEQEAERRLRASLP